MICAHSILEVIFFDDMIVQDPEHPRFLAHHVEMLCLLSTFVLVDMDGDTSDLFQTSVDGSWRGPQIPRTHLMKPDPVVEANLVLAIKKQHHFFATGGGHQTGQDMNHGTPMGIF